MLMSVESSAPNQPIQLRWIAPAITLLLGALLATAAHAQPEVRVTVSAPAVAAPVAPPPAAAVVVAPPGVVVAPPHALLPVVVAAPVTPAGQWVYTRQYGWLYMPYAQNYTYVPPAGPPSMFVYYPARGWRWVHAPWIVGVGPVPYWGPHGYVRFAWYARPWFARPMHWHHHHHHHHRYVR
jgi:hypothetical protein